MTIALSDNTPRISYSVSEGVTQTSFAVPFIFFDGSTDLNVFVDNVARTYSPSTSNTTLFTVTGGNGATGTITTTVTGASGGSTVIITRDVPLARTTDFPSAGAFEIAKLNTELDTLLTMITDADDENSRALRLQDSDEAVSLTLPLKADRLGTVLGFNATTGAAEVGPTIADVSSLSAITADISTLADIEDGTDATDAIQTVAGISSNVTTVAGIASNVTTVAGITANIASVVADEADIGTVAANISSVNTVATNIADVIIVANDLAEAVSEVETVANDLNEAVSEIDTVAGSISNVDTVGTNIANVNTVAGISANVTTVAGINANVTTVAGISSNVTTVAGISSDVTSVAADATDIGTVSTNIANVNTVAGISGNVTTVAGISANVTSVAGNATNINTVAGDTTAINAVASDATDIGTVATNIANVNTVAGISANVTTVAGDTANIGTIATDLTGSDNIGTVAGSISNVNSVGGSITNVNTVASNLASVNSFANTYRIGATDPTTSLDTGDLFYNTTSSALKVYTGSAWEQGVTAGSGFLPLTGGGLTGNLTFGDSNQALFGASSDLEIYHDGSDSYIKDTGVGNLIVRGTNIQVQDSSGHNFAFFEDTGTGGTVNLYHNASLKLNTTSTGIDVTGTVTADDVAISSSVPILRFTDTDTNETATVQTSNAGHILLDASQGNASGSGGLYVRTQAQTLRALFGSNGDISFYEDTGSTPKMVWKASDERLAIGHSSPNVTLHVQGANVSSGDANHNVSIDDTTSMAEGVGGGIVFRGNYGSGITNGGFIQTKKSNGTSGNYAFDLVLGSRPNGGTPTERMRIDSSGDFLFLGGTLRIKDSGNTAQRGAIYGSASEFHLNAGVDNMVLTTSGGEAMRIDSSGNVAIGHTSTGGSNFAICDGANSQIQFFAEISTDTNLIQHYDPTATAYMNSEHRANSHEFKIGTSNAVTINSSRNVGINESSPDTKLHVSHNVAGTPLATFENTASHEGSIRFKTAHSASSDFRVGASISASNNFEIYSVSASAARLQIDSSGNLKFNSGYGSSATAYGCRAWVKFNGTGTVAINGSANVSSITDRGTGSYTVNFSTAMPDANYSTSTSANFSGTGGWGSIEDNTGLYSSSSVGVEFVDRNGGTYDPNIFCVSIFR